MKNNETYIENELFRKIENYENYIFGIKEKAAFRYGDRKNQKKNIKRT